MFEINNPKFSSLEECLNFEYNIIGTYIPGEYIGISNVPNKVLLHAWIKLFEDISEHKLIDLNDETIGVLDEITAREYMRDIWNYKRNYSDLNLNDVGNIMNLIYASSGSSNYYNQLQPFMHSLDRFGSLRTVDNLEFNGPIFISRPRLCLQTSNLRNHRGMGPLDTSDPNSIPFAIRCLLDTNLHKNNPRYAKAYTSSPLFNHECAFLTPLCNAAMSISGFPDMLLETITTTGGFMSEAQQFVSGGDNLHRGTYDINITFKDVQYGPVAAILYYWHEYIRCLARGYMLAYADDVDQQRLNYTVSLYLFNLDPTRRYITSWCKCTGCFPRTFPMGAFMTREYNGARVKAITELSIPFVCNVVEYMDPAILIDFNRLVERYCPDINVNEGVRSTNLNRQGSRDKINESEYIQPDNYGYADGHMKTPTPHIPILNFTSLPWVTSDPRGFKLDWRLTNSQLSQNINSSRRVNLVDLGMLEMAAEAERFQLNSSNEMKVLNKHHYPGFSEHSDKFDMEDFNNFIDKAIKSGLN